MLWRCVTAKDPGVRAAAARVRGDWVGRFPPPAGAPPGPGQKVEAAALGEVTHLKLLVADTDPRVRLEAVRALSSVRTPRAVEVALAALDKPMDLFLDFALYPTVNDLADVWLPEFQAGRLKFDSAKKTQFALKAIRNPAAIESPVADLKAGKVAAEGRTEVAELIASVGGPDELAILFDTALAESTDNPTRAAILTALDRGVRRRNLKLRIDGARLLPLVDKATDSAVYFAALRLGGAMKTKALAPVLARSAHPGAPPEIRLARIGLLGDLGDAEALRAIVENYGSFAECVGGLAALVPLDPKSAAKLTAELLKNDPSKLPADADPTPLLAAFIKRKDGPKLLGEALRAEPPSADPAKIALRAVYALGSSDPVLGQPLQTAAGIGEAKPLTADELAKLVADVGVAGDPARGESVFRRTDAACLRCHAVGGAGGQLGPDVSSLGSAPVDYLVESILLPAKAVKEGYHSVVVETTDGDVLSGISVRQTDKELVLRDAVQDEIVIPLNTIKGKPREGQSMMPANLADALTRQELVDLVRFLSELGRPGPFALGTAPVARRWEVLDRDAAGGSFPPPPCPTRWGRGRRGTPRSPATCPSLPAGSRSRASESV